MNSLRLAGALTFTALTLWAAPDRIRESETTQQQLATDARKLVAQLEAMLGEYDRNGLAGEDVGVVKKLRDTLDNLSGREMQAIVDLLQKARAVTDAGEVKKTVSDAYANQKQIITEMKRLLAEHARQQEALELSIALTALADRQAANLQNGMALGKWSGGRKPVNLEKELEANLDGQKSEQAAIGDELKLLAGKIEKFAAELGSTEMTQRFQQAAAAAKGVQPPISAATAALQQGQLFKAVAEEKTARDGLRRLAKQIAPPQSPAEALHAAERELGKMITEQKAIAAEPLREKFEDFQALENAQGDLVSKNDLLAQDLARLAPGAAQALRAAQEKMQEARGAMADKAAADSAQAAQDALAKLEVAKADVAQQAVRAAAADGKGTGDRVKDLQALQKDVNDLAQQQAAAAQNPNKSPQAALAQQAQALAPRAAAMAPNAAAAMQQAAAMAQQAAQPQPPAQAAAMQQAAAQNLRQAAQQIAQAAAAAENAQRQLAVAQRSADELAEIIEAEQKLERDTAKLIAQPKPGMTGVFKGLPERQAEIRTKTGIFKSTLPADLEPAAAPLGDAGAAMDEAKLNLGRPDGPAADIAERKALADLYRAQRAIGEQMADAAAQLGENDAAQAQAMAAAAAQIAEAQAALAQAQQALEKASAPEAGAALENAAQQTGEAAAHAPGMSPAAQKSTQAAAQAAADAIAQAAGGNTPGARAKVGEAQAALAQAAAALGQAQAGIAPSGAQPMPGEGPPGAPKPGSKPGTKPGLPNGQPGTQAAQNYKRGGEQAVQLGARTTAAKRANFSGLPPRDRAAIEQAQAEKYPEEYGTLVEQYLRNLADESTRK